MHIFLSNFQYQIILTASRLALNLLERNEIIEFTHYLMDNGYYDDLMLNIIDDCNYLLIDELSELLSKTLENLNLITLNKEQAKCFYIFSLIYPLTIRPFKLPYLANHYLNNQVAENEILNSFSIFMLYNSIDYDVIDNLTFFRDYAYIIETDIYLRLDTQNNILEFLTECEHWLSTNQNTITTIIQRASLIK